jgi:hypothetical protein
VTVGLVTWQPVREWEWWVRGLAGDVAAGQRGGGSRGLAGDVAAGVGVWGLCVV